MSDYVFTGYDNLISGMCANAYSGAFTHDTKKYARLRLQGALLLATSAAYEANYSLTEVGDVLYITNNNNIIGRFLLDDDGFYEWKSGIDN